MLNTQRLSSLAFNLRDGRETEESKLTPAMKRLAIKYVVLWLLLHAHSVSWVLCGCECVIRGVGGLSLVLN